MSPGTCSDVHTSLYPVQYDQGNQGNTRVFTKEELVSAGINASVTSLQVDKSQKKVTALPRINSVSLAEILDTVAASTVILKLDIEGYECRALQPHILLGSTGKRIPLIFLEWAWLPANDWDNCPGYTKLIQLFHDGGYSAYYPGSGPGGPGTLDPVPPAGLDKAMDLVWVHTELTKGYHEAIRL
jgi:hypothetical protein